MSIESKVCYAGVRNCLFVRDQQDLSLLMAHIVSISARVAIVADIAMNIPGFINVVCNSNGLLASLNIALPMSASSRRCHDCSTLLAMQFAYWKTKGLLTFEFTRDLKQIHVLNRGIHL